MVTETVEIMATDESSVGSPRRRRPYDPKKATTTVLRWDSLEEKEFVQKAAKQDNRPLTNFMVNAAKLRAEEQLGYRLGDDEFADDDDEEYDDE